VSELDRMHVSGQQCAYYQCGRPAEVWEPEYERWLCADHFGDFTADSGEGE
jgi:hypothetical protein